MSTTTFATTNTVSRVIPKRQFQQIRQSLVSNGYLVTKLDAGYECRAKKGGKLVLKAMNGTRGYLVRYCKELFE